MKGHPALVEALHSEWGLILFTTLVPIACGIVLIGMLAGSPIEAGITAVVVAGLGLLASVGHLDRPVRAPFSIRHLRTSWLSREILMAVIFFLLTLTWAIVSYLNYESAIYLGIAALIAAIPLFLSMGESYLIWARPAWDGPEIFAEIATVILIAGFPAGELAIASAKPANWLGWVGVSGVAVGLGLYYWATNHRLHRLASLTSQRHNASESLARCQSLRGSFQVAFSLGVLALIGAIIAVTTELYIAGWATALGCGLVSQLLSRTLFYSLPVQTRYVVPIKVAKW